MDTSAQSPIVPTVGRIVLVNSVQWEGDYPAIVNMVHSDNCISVTVFPFNGMPHPLTSIVYADDHAKSGQSISWHWMEYQKAVAAERDPSTGAAKA